MARRILFQQALNKKVTESLFFDGLHPNADGYERLGKFIETQIQKLNK
jgi:lysophospholipase L1-like esterase